MPHPTRLLCIVLFVSWFSRLANAHPGHAVELVPSSLPHHYLLQPEHAVLVWAALAVLCAVLIHSAWAMLRHQFASPADKP